VRSEVLAGLLILIVVGLLLPTALAAASAAIGVALLVVVHAWGQALARGVEVEVEVAERWVTHETGDIVVHVANRSRWPAPRVRVELRLGSGGLAPPHHVFELSLPPRRARSFELQVEAQTRGRWRTPPVTVRLGDPWGLLEIAGRPTSLPELIVLPTVVPVRRLRVPNAAPVPEIADSTSLLDDPLAIVGVRAYEPGDPLRSIHWPATAASGELVRREVERAQAREVLVVLDVDDRSWRGGGRPFEAAVTVAASVLVDAIRHRRPAGLLVSQPGEEPTAAATVARFRIGGGRRHLDAMLAHLAGVQRHHGVDLETLLTSHAPREQPGTTVVMVTGRLDPAAATRALKLRARGLTAMVVEVRDPATGAAEPGLQPRPVIPVARVAADRPLQELVL
jgi:uncharacterized protein (DUF58 family)